MQLPQQLNVRVTAVDEINSVVKRFTFERIDGKSFPAFSGGSHIVVEMEDDDKRHRNAYSLMSDPNDPSIYQISVRRDDEGRGGSLYMHNKVKEGMEMKISYPTNLFTLDMRGGKHILIAGGIGITPIMAHMQQLQRVNGDYEVHYAVRSDELGAYTDVVRDEHGKRAHVYRDSEGEKIDLDTLLDGQSPDTHVYICGPQPMIDWVEQTARDKGWPEGRVHAEQFLAPEIGEPFKVRLAKSEIEFTVADDQSLLEAIEAAGVDVPYLCRGGACGQCETNIIEADGDIIHRDHWLTDAQREEAKLIMPCVSRFEGNLLIIDR